MLLTASGIYYYFIQNLTTMFDFTLFKPQKMKAIFFLYLYVQNFWTNVIGLGNFSSPDLKVSVINVYCPLIKKTFPSKTTGSIKIQISCISYGL